MLWRPPHEWLRFSRQSSFTPYKAQLLWKRSLPVVNCCQVVLQNSGASKPRVILITIFQFSMNPGEGIVFLNPEKG